MMYQIMFLVGIVTFAVMFLRGSKIIRTDWSAVAKFVGFMTLATAVRFSIMEGDSSIWLENSPASFKDFMWVFWEDCFFALPIYLVKDHLKCHKIVWVSVAIALSCMFAYGHLAYGLLWAIVTLAYPYFISYKYGSLYGFGTVMACHIIYDWATLLTVKLYKLASLIP